jgi:flagellar protein FlbT
MPLKVQLKPSEKIIINGSVLQAPEDGRTEFTVLNESVILREKHVMTEAEADTPAKRLYLTTQLMYIDEADRDSYQDKFSRFLNELREAVALPPVTKALDTIEGLVAQEDFYMAMKINRKLIEVEEKLLNMAPDQSKSEAVIDLDIEKIKQEDDE